VKRSHALLLAILLGAAALAAAFAVLTTTSLGMSAKQPSAVSDAQIAARNAKLDKAEAALRRALEKKPPALPKLPKHASAPGVRAAGSSGHAQTAMAVPAAAPTVVASSSDDGGSHESEPEDIGGGGDD
jgi:hypothetical protein